MIDIKCCAGLIILVVIMSLVNGAENYMDYGEDMAEKTTNEKIHELYRLLFQRNAMQDAADFNDGLEHLMIRKSQRSPSLRLRFGRSAFHARDPFRPMDAMTAGYKNN